MKKIIKSISVVFVLITILSTTFSTTKTNTHDYTFSASENENETVFLQSFVIAKVSETVFDVDVLDFYIENKMKDIILDISDISLEMETAKEISKLLQEVGLNAYLLINSSVMEDENLSNHIETDGFGGVILDYSTSEVSFNEQVENLKSKLQSKSGIFGIIVDKDDYEVDYSGVEVDFIIPKIDVGIERISTHKDYIYYVDKWNLVDGVDIIFPITIGEVLSNIPVDIYEISAQVFYLKNIGKKQVILNTSFDADESRNYYINRLKNWFFHSESDVKEISEELIIGRPETNISVYSTGYNIFGTSNPDYDLYCNGVLVETRGTGGTFSHFVDLSVGDNVFVFKQAEVEKSIMITRIVSSKTQKTITDITQSSMLPTKADYTYSGGVYELKCIAPSNGLVTAQIGEYLVELKQQAVADTGIPAVYRGTLNIENKFTRDEITNIGNVSYNLSYDGISSTYQSSGELFIAGMDTVVGAKSINHMTNLFGTLDDISTYNYSTTLKLGQWDYIVDATDNYFKLSMGDYVNKDDIVLVDVYKESKGRLNTINYNYNEDSETLILDGVSGHISKLDISEENVWTFKFYDMDASNVSLIKLNKILEKAILKSNLFESANIYMIEENEKQSFAIDFIPKTTIWGYNVQPLEMDRDFKDKTQGTILYFKKTPSSQGATPLAGKIVVLDPGHGGKDTGALGTATTDGPMEKDLTLKTARATKKYLEEEGAIVLMTRDDDTFVELLERAIISEKIKPDVFVSIHLNSVAVTTDSKAKGAEIYYYNSTSKILAQSILDSITSTVPQREDRGVRHGAYIVARPTITPSVLCEIGFMSNAQEYENMTKESVIDKTGLAISKGISDCILQGNISFN